MTQEMLQLLPASLFDLTDNEDNAKFWSIFSDQMDELDEVFIDLKYIRDIQSQSGVVLDLIGEMLWEKRDGKLDTEYQIYLTIAIQKMLCSGAEPDISNVFRALLGDYFIGVRDLYPDAPEATGIDLYLDGSWYLNGDYYLGDGTVRKPAFFDIVVKPSTPENLKTILKQIVGHLRGAGIACKLTELEG